MKKNHRENLLDHDMFSLTMIGYCYFSSQYMVQGFRLERSLSRHCHGGMGPAIVRAVVNSSKSFYNQFRSRTVF